jgi:hypothetical protein
LLFFPRADNDKNIGRKQKKEKMEKEKQRRSKASTDRTGISY